MARRPSTRRDEGSRETLESIRSSREMLDNLRDVIAHGRQSLEEHGLPWKQVTSATGLSRTTCTRLRTSALEHLGELAGDPQEGKTTRREHYK